MSRVGKLGSGGGGRGLYRTRTLEKCDEKKWRRGGNNNINNIRGSYSYSITMSIGEDNGRLTVISCYPYSGRTLLMYSQHISTSAYNPIDEKKTSTDTKTFLRIKSM